MTLNTYIIFDTNTLHLGKYKDFSKYDFNKFYHDILGKIERHDVVNNFKLMIPQIAVDEIYKQQLEAFDKVKENFLEIKQKCENLYGIEMNINPKLNYSEFLKEVKENFLKHNDVKILPVCNENRFSKIVERALNKQAPFEGGDKGKSDKGFKDALIWESILEFANSIDEPCEFIFITNDKGFHAILINEFETITGKKITFYSKDDQQRIDLQIEKYSEDKVVRNKIATVKQYILDSLEDFINLVEEEMQKKLEVNGLNCNITKFELDPVVVDLNDQGSDLFQFKLRGKILAEKPGVSYDLIVNLKSLAEVGNEYSLQKLSVDEIEATLLSGDNVNIRTNLIEFLSHGDELEQELLERDEDPKKDLNDGTKMADREQDRLKNLEVIYKLELSRYKQIIDENSIDINEENFSEFIQSLENKLNIDWFKFPSNFAKVKLEIKKFFQKNGINRDILEDLVELFIDKLITDSKKVSEAAIATPM
ncbi:PIN domain-containing protein [Psychrobacillus sp. L3]|uniref:PIN domain-containing protein n=1 Tax=Psychrobacillus sp. L3 TaxID=3236891 RepID=UPI0036F3D3B0